MMPLLPSRCRILPTLREKHRYRNCHLYDASLLAHLLGVLDGIPLALLGNRYPSGNRSSLYIHTSVTP